MRAFSVGLLMLLDVGCVRSLPPADLPAPRRLDFTQPPTQELGRILLDVGPGRVRVDEIINGSPRRVLVAKDLQTETVSRSRTVFSHRPDGELQSGTVTEPESRVTVRYAWETVTDSRLIPLCQAPCALDLPQGPHDLHLQSIEDKRWANLRIEATSAPRTYRVGLGHTLAANDVFTQLLLGLVLLTPGASILTAAAVDWGAVARQQTTADRDRIQSDSTGLTIVGGALFVAGVVTLVLMRSTEQETVVQISP